MDEEVLSIVLLDETKALLLVEPLYFSFCHSDILLLCVYRISLNVDSGNKKTPSGEKDPTALLYNLSATYHSVHPIVRNIEYISKNVKINSRG
jgi:hypothetical protein